MNLFDLSGFQRDLLYVIAGFENPSGQDVKEELERYLDEEINHGRLYPNLDTLVERGYVEKGQIDRRTNSYRITDSGRQQLQDRREWEDGYLQAEALASS
ncbi:PadR family transcriptional regulator [Halegenticoccus soli]|uniref:PadR family transcriptional regulator n=1 Tax=Halegenticoccus soli TaxID=1985678 RepID=UPI000C6CD105|nr:PadR family transcriptional regulator [Halegenticoccus soli]